MITNDYEPYTVTVNCFPKHLVYIGCTLL